MSHRTCGECRACCTTHGVPEINKPVWQPCPHECAQGCAIYATRPAACAGFECLWLKGQFKPEDRPDKLGFVLTPGHDLPNGERVVVAHVATPGAHKTERAARFYKLLGSRRISLVLVFDAKGRRFLPATEAAAAAVKAVLGRGP